MTRQEIRDMARKTLGETTSAFWTDIELNSYINAGCRDLAFRTKSLRSNTTFGSVSCVQNTVASASNEYVLSTLIPNYFAVTEVYFKNDGKQYLRLDPSSREELDYIHSGWQALIGYTLPNTATGITTYNKDSQCSIPFKYYWDREEDKLGLYPPPNAEQAGSDYVKVYFTHDHAPLSADSSTPTLPTPLHLAIVDFTVAKGFEDRGWGDRANDAWSKFFQKIKDYGTEKGKEREDEEIVMRSFYNRR